MSTSPPAYRNGSTPTVLLVHGAFADASSWAGVIPALLATGMDVIAPANPLRGLRADAAYLASVAAEIDGPVLLVGHAYGGAVITAAGAHAGNVVGLVYISGYAVDEGESVLDVNGRFPPSRLGEALRPTSFPNGNGMAGVEVSIKHDAFSTLFAADLPGQLTAVMAVAQRPIATAAAWRTLPTWYLVATADQVIHPEAQRFMARRAGARTVEVDASHAVALSQAATVADLISAAAVADRPRPAHTSKERP